MDNFITNSFNTYYWQIISFCIRFFSLFIVTPFISENITIFGVYAFCISLIIFYNYADLGFLRAAAKFSSEKVKLNDINSELKIFGFSGFILMIMCLIIMLGLSIIVFDPTLVISQLDNSDDIKVAKDLLLILVFSSPIYMLLRIIQTIYEVRIKSYMYNKIIILISFFSIISAYYFFGISDYDIVGYFLFIQIFNLIALFFLVKNLKKYFNYPILDLLKNFKFSKKYYFKIKKLAFSSLLISVTWIIFIELDSLYIIKNFGPDALALFTISLTFFTLFRFLFSTIFTPINTQINYLVVDKKKGLLSKFIRRLFLLSPIFIISSYTSFLFCDNFIRSWVGSDFINSISLAKYFSLFYLFGFFGFISGSYLIAISKVKILNINSILLPLFFWSIIYFISFKYYLTIEKFVFTKLLIFLVSNFFTGLYVLYLQKITLISIIFDNKYVLISLIILYFCDFYLEDIFPNNKSFINLLVTITFIVFSFFLSLIPMFFLYPHSKEINILIKSLKNSK